MTITGSGTLGRELAKLLQNDYDLRIMDNNENALWECEEIVPNALYVLGDIRDPRRVDEVLMGSKAVINTAAIKHVRYAVQNPLECVATNIEGLVNILRISRGWCEKVIHISSDKVCHPANIYGETKKLGEMLMASSQCPGRYCWRFGNFLGSQGSVFERWRKQFAESGRIRLTDPEMNRFFIRPEEVAKYVADSLGDWTEDYEKGSVFIPQMRAYNMGIIADIVAEKWGCEVDVVGAGPGEKRDEYIIAEDESFRTTVESNHMGYCIHPKPIEGGLTCAVTTEIVPLQARNATKSFLEGTI